MAETAAPACLTGVATGSGDGASAALSGSTGDADKAFGMSAAGGSARVKAGASKNRTLTASSEFSSA
jgi:hypothetical protein